MTIKINHYFKATSLFLIILFLPTILYAFDTIKNIPSRNTYFTGRTACLDNMQRNLLKYGKIYLTGYGGIGKTQLAKEFSYIHEKDYDLIWWFDLRSNLEVQYENLLTHLGDDKRFKELLHVKIKDIAPSVFIDFTNSLLSKYRGNWLLIFDNLPNNQDTKLPKTRTTGQHVIVTTREKQTSENNILTIGPFTNKEAEQFLLKIHPKEKKEEIVKLYKRLHNYPLALAQISKEILLYDDGVDSYLKRHDINLSTNLLKINSDVTQKYNSNYHEVLNMTLQNIEQKDEETAKILYMLALMPTDLTKKFLRDLFGNKAEEKLITLNSHGIIQTTRHNNSQILNIHDVIKEEVMTKFNSKDQKYKKDVISSLIKKCNDLYSDKDLQYFNNLDASNNHVTSLYAFVNIALQNNIINEGVINALIIALRLNNVLLNKRADPVLYQRLTNQIYGKDLDNIPSIKKALLYSNLILANSVIYESSKNLSEFTTKILRLLTSIESQKNHKDLFFIHTHLILFYLISGDFKEAEKYAEKAKINIDYADNASVLLYWFNNAWLYYELRDIDKGIKALDNYIKLNDSKFMSQVGKLFARDFKIKFMILMGQKDNAKKELKEAIKDAEAYYGNTSSGVTGELEYTKTLLYFQEGQYKLAEKQCHHALNIFAKVFGGDVVVDLSQAHLHIMLGKTYEVRGNNVLALKEYKRALKFYDEKSYGKMNRFHEHGELLSNLCIFYYKQKDFVKSKFYYKKLISNFGLNHNIVEKLIKILPRDHVYKMNAARDKGY